MAPSARSERPRAVSAALAALPGATVTGSTVSLLASEAITLRVAFVSGDLRTAADGARQMAVFLGVFGMLFVAAIPAAFVAQSLRRKQAQSGALLSREVTPTGHAEPSKRAPGARQSRLGRFMSAIGPAPRVIVTILGMICIGLLVLALLFLLTGILAAFLGAVALAVAVATAASIVYATARAVRLPTNPRLPTPRYQPPQAVYPPPPLMYPPPAAVYPPPPMSYQPPPAMPEQQLHNPDDLR